LNCSYNLSIALSASLAAGEMIMEIYNSEDFAVELKQDNSPLTRADKASHKIITDILSSLNKPILSEEDDIHPYKERKSWESFWIVDPIDGTKEFIKRNGEFTVNVALIQNNTPVLGVVYAPATKELYFAEHGLGAFKIENISDFDQLENASNIDLSNSNQNLPKTYTLVVSKSHMNQETENYVHQMKIEYGSVTSKSFGSSLKICKVAEGYAHCYPRFGPTMEWDTAAAHAVAKYAGCNMIAAKSSEPLSYNKENLLNPFFIVSREII
jgi:3'(2'), 5'-bisphosphate nucleotidase